MGAYFLVDTQNIKQLHQHAPVVVIRQVWNVITVTLQYGFYLWQDDGCVVSAGLDSLAAQCVIDNVVEVGRIRSVKQRPVQICSRKRSRTCLR